MAWRGVAWRGVAWRGVAWHAIAKGAINRLGETKQGLHLGLAKRGTTGHNWQGSGRVRCPTRRAQLRDTQVEPLWTIAVSLDTL